MGDFFYAIILYPSGHKVRLVHKGRDPTKATMALLGRINASIEVGGEVPPDVAADAAIAESAVAGMRRLRAQAQLDDLGDDGD